MVRIRTEGRKTVFEYRGVRRQDAAEKVREHMALFKFEQPRIEGTVDQFGPPVPAPPIIAEWVENAGTPQETVEVLPVPTAG